MGYTYGALKSNAPEMVELPLDYVRNPSFLKL
jgi:predicted Zn-dependent peptidase